MTRWTGVALAVGLLVAGRGAAADAPRPPWTGDYETAKAEARRTNKPLLVVFRCVP